MGATLRAIAAQLHLKGLKPRRFGSWHQTLGPWSRGCGRRHDDNEFDPAVRGQSVPWQCGGSQGRLLVTRSERREQTRRSLDEDERHGPRGQPRRLPLSSATARALSAQMRFSSGTHRNGRRLRPKVKLKPTPARAGGGLGGGSAALPFADRGSDGSVLMRLRAMQT